MAMAAEVYDPPAGAHHGDVAVRASKDEEPQAALQVRLLLSRYVLSVPRAYVVAELAFSNGGAE
jgi:hypothetical protein